MNAQMTCGWRIHHSCQHHQERWLAQVNPSKIHCWVSNLGAFLASCYCYQQCDHLPSSRYSFQMKRVRCKVCFWKQCNRVWWNSERWYVCTLWFDFCFLTQFLWLKRERGVSRSWICMIPWDDSVSLGAVILRYAHTSDAVHWFWNGCSRNYYCK